MIPDDEIIIEDELLTPEDEAVTPRVLFDELPESLGESAKDYPE